MIRSRSSMRRSEASRHHPQRPDALGVGLDWQEDYEYAPLNSSVVAMLYTRGRDDMARFTAEHAAARSAGKAYLYSSGDSTVLAAALKNMVGQQAYPDYPWTALFDPLGIRGAVWETDGSGTFVGRRMPT